MTYDVLFYSCVHQISKEIRMTKEKEKEKEKAPEKKNLEMDSIIV